MKKWTDFESGHCPKMMDTLLTLLLLLAVTGASNVTKGLLEPNNTNVDHEDPLEKVAEDALSHITASTLGTIIVAVVVLGCLIYYCSSHKKAPEEGFTQLENESNGPPRNNRWRWKNRRFCRRNQRRNYQPNPPDAPHVVIQNVVSVGTPAEILHAEDIRFPNTMPTSPPPYDGGMNNQRYFHGDNVRQTKPNHSRFTRY